MGRKNLGTIGNETGQTGRIRPDRETGGSTSSTAAGRNDTPNTIRNGSNAGTETPKTPVSLGLPEIIIPTPAVEKRGPGRPPGTGKKAVEAKPAKNLMELSDNIRILLVSGFAMLAVRTGPVWEVTEAEADSIAKPLSKIMDKAGQTETVNKYSDYIMLLTALAVVILPRLLVTKQLKTMTKPTKEVNTIDRTRPATTEVKRDNYQDNYPVTGTLAGALSDVLEPVN